MFKILLITSSGILLFSAGIFIIRAGVKEKYNVPAIGFGLLLCVLGSIYLLFLSLSIKRPSLFDESSTIAGEYWSKFTSFNDFTSELFETISAIIFSYLVFTTYFTRKGKSLRSLLLSNLFGKLMSLVLLLLALYSLYVIGIKAYSIFVLMY